MDITPLDAAAVAAIKFDTALPVNTATVVAAAQQGQDMTNASVVQFSPLAQLLAVTARFQARQVTQLPPGSASINVNQPLEQLAAASNNFVQAFNNFQISVTSQPTNPLELAFDHALLAAIHDKSSQDGTASVQSFIDSMAQVGVQFQEAGHPLMPNQFQFQFTALEAAYSTNPLQTATLLNNAFEALSIIEAQLLNPKPAQIVNDSLTAAQAAERINASNAASNAVANAASTAQAIAAVDANAAAMLQTGDPATIDPLIATAVAAYRLAENLAPGSIPAPTEAANTNVSAPGKVDAAGPDTENDNGVAKRSNT